MKNGIIKLVLFLAVFFYVAGCKEKPKSTGNQETKELSEKDYAAIGVEYATSTQKTLGKNLMEALQKGGSTEALDFCNIQAIPLTDSMATIHDANIKRVTDKPRNPANLANSEQLIYIENFKKMVAMGEDIEPIVKTGSEKVHFYLPIITNAMCLQCHGKRTDQIQPATMDKLQELYPQDQATGYSENEVRGIWAISYNK